MSLRIKHLNADSSFLLVFSPAGAPNNTTVRYPGSFSILVDPWLSGPSTVWHEKFAHTHHVIPACLDSLADLPEPDLVLVSQDKPDHCHRATLMQLPPNVSTLILAPPAAAAKIRSWHHFNPRRVQSLRSFDDRRDTVVRIPIPSFSPSGADGELTVSLITSRFDLTGLHNAIGITYRPPSSALSQKHGTFVTLPLTPPTTPPAHRSPDPDPLSRSRAILLPPQRPPTNLHDTPLGSREKTLSLIYTPHGIDYSFLKPYCTSHLLLELALPLTALIHSFARTTNPWYFGGNISTGASGGIEIARNLFARAWVGAHDEDKHNTGFVVRSLKVERTDLEAVRKELSAGQSPGKAFREARRKRIVRDTVLLDLGAGEEFVLTA